MEKRVLLLLFLHPPHHTMAAERVLAPVYRAVYGPLAFLDLGHVEANLCSGRSPLLEKKDFRVAGGGGTASPGTEESFTLSPLAASLIRLVNIGLMPFFFGVGCTFSSFRSPCSAPPQAAR